MHVCKQGHSEALVRCTHFCFRVQILIMGVVCAWAVSVQDCQAEERCMRMCALTSAMQKCRAAATACEHALVMDFLQCLTSCMHVGLSCACICLPCHVIFAGEMHGSHSFDGRQTPGTARHSTTAARCAAEPMQAPVQICSRGNAQSPSLQTQLQVATHNYATAVAILLTLMILTVRG